ncbi:MAG TPA: SPOR domain-containing protein [Caldithrix abyssi]|uniref:SPOR domain-containing protein n=1 Tax=Caldithrix abyssi TaxID=187145 RepID=A0A7V1PVI9_CALAY|nr:SPOR domain-containing protein [Caldithrix abyssi]
MKYTLLAVALLFLSTACNPGLVRQERLANKRPAADSTLYYSASHIGDPFLDSLKTDTARVSLVLTLYPPPPPPPPKFRQIEGFRVQLFAGLDSLNGRVIAGELQGVMADSVYFFKEKGLYKVQAGDYPWRHKADRMVLDLRKKGYAQGWVVRRLINVPADTSLAAQADSLQPQKDVTPPVEAKFQIQVLVTSDKEKAQGLAGTLRQRFQQEVYIQPAGTIYKVLLGRFAKRSEAEKVLKKIKQNGYKDAWLVY